MIMQMNRNSLQLIKCYFNKCFQDPNLRRTTLRNQKAQSLQLCASLLSSKLVSLLLRCGDSERFTSLGDIQKSPAYPPCIAVHQAASSWPAWESCIASHLSSITVSLPILSFVGGCGSRTNCSHAKQILHQPEYNTFSHIHKSVC